MDAGPVKDMSQDVPVTLTGMRYMNVWIADWCFDICEPETIIGVYSTEEKAQEALRKWKAKESVWGGIDGITEWTVDDESYLHS